MAILEGPRGDHEHIPKINLVSADKANLVRKTIRDAHATGAGIREHFTWNHGLRLDRKGADVLTYLLSAHEALAIDTGMEETNELVEIELKKELNRRVNAESARARGTEKQTAVREAFYYMQTAAQIIDEGYQYNLEPENEKIIAQEAQKWVDKYKVKIDGAQRNPKAVLAGLASLAAAGSIGWFGGTAINAALRQANESKSAIATQAKPPRSIHPVHLSEDMQIGAAPKATPDLTR